MPGRSSAPTVGRWKRVLNDYALIATFGANPTTPDNASLIIKALAVGGTIVVPNGTFAASGSAAGRISRFLADGTIDSSFATGSGADNLIFAVLLQSDFKVVFAGDFATVNSAVRGRITDPRTLA